MDKKFFQTLTVVVCGGLSLITSYSTKAYGDDRFNCICGLLSRSGPPPCNPGQSWVGSDARNACNTLCSPMCNKLLVNDKGGTCTDEDAGHYPPCLTSDYTIKNKRTPKAMRTPPVTRSIQ